MVLQTLTNIKNMTLKSRLCTYKHLFDIYIEYWGTYGSMNRNYGRHPFHTYVDEMKSTKNINDMSSFGFHFLLYVGSTTSTTTGEGVIFSDKGAEFLLF